MLFDIRHVSNEGSPSHIERGLDYDIALEATLAEAQPYESIYALKEQITQLGFKISGGTEVRKLPNITLENSLRGETVAVCQIYLDRDGKRYGTLELGITQDGIDHLETVQRGEYTEPLTDAETFFLATLMLPINRSENARSVEGSPNLGLHLVSLLKTRTTN